MNKILYISAIVGGGILALIFMIIGSNRSTSEMMLAVPIPLIFAAVFHLMMVYKMWASIQDGQARTTPGKAVGFLFIPFYNLYWLFNVYGGFATDYNNYIAKKGIAAKPLPNGLFVVNVILMLFSVPVVNWVVNGLCISKICDAVNAVRK